MISISGAWASLVPDSTEGRLTQRSSAQPASNVRALRWRGARLESVSPWLAAGLASVALACSDDSASTIPTGGTSGGGSAGQSAGGQTATAGTTGTAGAPGGGGTSAGGTSSTGGTGSTDLPPLRTFNFSADIEAWTFVYADPPGLIAAAAPAGDAGVDGAADAGAASGVATASHDAVVGDPNGDPGSVRLDLPFSGPLQKISFEVNVAPDGTVVNLAGRSIAARVRVDSGWSADPNNPAGLKLYVKTGATSVYADSAYNNVGPGADWQTFTWPNVSNPGYVDPAGVHNPADVRQVGIEFDTGAAGVYSAAVIHLDTVVY